VITAVLDTNVLASGFLRSQEDSVVVRIFDAWRNRQFDLVVSQHILQEFARTLASPYFRRRLTAQQVAADLALLQSEAIVAPITVDVHGVATHPEDDLILATAVSAEADYLVTGDLKLQRLEAYQEVTILAPKAFMQLLDEQFPEDPAS